MRIWLLSIAGVLLALAGCFEPRFKDDLRCGPAGDCPPGLSCGADDVCHAVGVPDGRGPDALVIADAMPVTCTDDGDCQSPPNLCLLAGVCDLGAGVCNFTEVDCTGLDRECAIGMCEPTTGSCIAVGAHEDDTCGAGVVCGAFGTCAGFADGVCDSSGEQTRDCTRNACQNGACVADPYVETAACTRMTEGSDCAADTVDACGPCDGFSTTCDEGGTQTCQCTESRCASDMCARVTTSCSQACSRDTDRVSCGAMTVSGCTPESCGYTSSCDQAAPDQSCTCTTFTCVAGACSGSDAACQRSCARTTDGDDCGCVDCGGPGQLHERSARCNTTGACVGFGVCTSICEL